MRKPGLLIRLSFCLPIACCGAAEAREPIQVYLDPPTAETCPLHVEGQAIVLPADETRLQGLFAQLKHQGRRPVAIIADPATPYRCITAVIAVAQRTHLEVRFVPRFSQPQR